MAKTLLNATNEILKRVGLVAGDAGELASLTDSARQRAIDIAVQVINEGIDEIFSTALKPMPLEQAEATLTLVQGTQGYPLPTDLVTMVWPLVDKANSQFLNEYPGGYNRLLIDDPEQDDTGLAQYATIRPTDGYLFLDRSPTSVEAGRVYTFQYEKDLELDSATDTVPFGNATFRAMVPAWVQLWKREMRNDFDTELYRASLGRAARFLTQKPMRSNYCPR